MIWIFIQAIPTLDGVVLAIGIGALAVGIIPMIVFWRKGAAYYSRRPLELPDELAAATAADPVIEAEKDGELR